MRVCIFDLDHTLVGSSLDLAAMALDMRACVERALGPLPARNDRYRVGELIAHCQREAPKLEPTLWEVALDHERRAVADAKLEPGAREAVAGARAAGFHTAVWTNNAREVAEIALAKFDLLGELDLVVARDDMRALKPDPDGWRVIVDWARDADLTTADAIVIGDSWVDGVAAAAAGLPFVAYQAREEELARWSVTPVARLTDLGALPAWLAGWRAR